MKIFSKTILAAMVCLAFLSAVPVFAANISFETKSRELRQGDDFITDVVLNTQGESLNALEGKIVFPANLLEVKEIRDGSSIVNFWIERPRPGNGEIIFSGIIPGGYQENRGSLLSIVFRANAIGSGTIEMRDARILLNNGRGTPARNEISALQFSIAEKTSAPQAVVEPIRDMHPPEEFTPEISHAQNIFDGKYFLVFATQDKESGIDHYEVREGVGGGFIRAQSPYLLPNQKLDERIFVKAVDKNNNERIVTLLPQKPLPWYEHGAILTLLIIIGIVIFSAVLLKLLWRKYTKLP